MNLIRRLTIVVLMACSTSALYAADSSYPSRPIRVIVPFAPGGSTDILVRILGQQLHEQLAQPVVIDNRGGAGGMIGAELAAKSTPDGHTIMITTSGVIVVNPSLYRKLSYDPFTDFVPITNAASLPNMLVVSSSFPANNVKELLALARAKPGTLTYASGGNGTSNHLSAELMKYLTGVKVTHVPYKGGGPAVLAAMTGEVSMLFATMPSAMRQVKAGKLKALAVTSRKRSQAIPELPTMAEAGVKDFEFLTWAGVLAPRGTPNAYIAKLNSEIGKVLQVPTVAARLRALGYDPVGSSPAEMTALMKTETALWARVIESAGIRAN